MAEKKIEYDFVLDSPWSPDSLVPDLNPLGKIPVLVLDDVFAELDSQRRRRLSTRVSTSTQVLALTMGKPSSGRLTPIMPPPPPVIRRMQKAGLPRSRGNRRAGRRRLPPMIRMLWAHR